MNEVWIASSVLLWVLVLLMGFLLAGALRQLGIIQMRLGDDPGALITDSGLDRGTYAPDFNAPAASSSDQVRLSDLEPRARMLIFVSPTCLSCRELIPHINEVAATRNKEFDFLVVCQGDVDGCAAFVRTNRLTVEAVVDATGDISRDYQVNLTPFAYLLDYEGRVVIRGIANDWRQLESLLEQEGTPEAGMLWETIDRTGSQDGGIDARANK